MTLGERPERKTRPVSPTSQPKDKLEECIVLNLNMSVLSKGLPTCLGLQHQDSAHL